MPFVGGMFKIIFMNAEELFMFPRNMAQQYKKSYRQRFFDRVNLHAIRGPEVEVSLWKIRKLL